MSLKKQIINIYYVVLKSCRKTSTTTSGEEQLNTASAVRFFHNLKYVIEDASDSIEMCAVEYKLQGKSIGELCEHNANVASNAGKHTVSNFQQ